MVRRPGFWPDISTVLSSILAGCSLEFFNISISQIIYIASSKACSSFYILYFMPWGLQTSYPQQEYKNYTRTICLFDPKSGLKFLILNTHHEISSSTKLLLSITLANNALVFPRWLQSFVLSPYLQSLFWAMLTRNTSLKWRSEQVTALL